MPLKLFPWNIITKLPSVIVLSILLVLSHVEKNTIHSIAVHYIRIGEGLLPEKFLGIFLAMCMPSCCTLMKTNMITTIFWQNQRYQKNQLLHDDNPTTFSNAKQTNAEGNKNAPPPYNGAPTEKTAPNNNVSSSPSQATNSIALPQEASNTWNNTKDAHLEAIRYRHCVNFPTGAIENGHVESWTPSWSRYFVKKANGYHKFR